MTSFSFITYQAYKPKNYQWIELGNTLRKNVRKHVKDANVVFEDKTNINDIYTYISFDLQKLIKVRK